MNVFGFFNLAFQSAVDIVFTPIPVFHFSLGTLSIFVLVLVFIGSWILEDPGSDRGINTGMPRRRRR